MALIDLDVSSLVSNSGTLNVQGINTQDPAKAFISSGSNTENVTFVRPETQHQHHTISVFFVNVLYCNNKMYS